MSEENKEQPVVDQTDAPSKTDAEAGEARTDDLDTLLADYEKEVSQTQKPASEQKPGTDDVRKEIEALRNEISQREFKADMKATIDDIRGDLDPAMFDDGFMEAWLDGQARKDERLQRAWLDRHDNPQRFKRVKAELARQLSDRFNKRPDRAVTEDVEAVAASVRGASTTKAPEGKAPDYSRMSDKEFAESIANEHGFRPPL